MSSPEDRPSPHEIVIVRRRGGRHDEGHHGGAWKIAFADFMTALMCFFLVMWLINASDKKTISQIATYFNPIQLNDRVTSKKGLEESETNSPIESGREKTKSKATPSELKDKKRVNDGPARDGANRSTQAERILASEIDLIRDPYGIIEQIVAAQPAAGRVGLAGGDARSRLPKDLFDPQSSGAIDGIRDGQRSTADRSQSSSPPAQANSKSSQPSAAPGELTAERLKSDIADAMNRFESQFKPMVEVIDQGREVLVSITDNIEQEMYGIGSSRPTPMLVQIMDAVGRALAGKGGAVVVRGHTDARPYSSSPYDNWRLSSARAQVAYHMLVRGGLPPERVQQIEGHADRRLRIPADPLAPQNRRIEILVSKEKQ